MTIVPLEQLLYANFHPDASISITFQQERIVHNGTEIDAVLQIARRDMAKGEENFLWPGRFSNSDLVLRWNFTFQPNHIGVGDNVTAKNWNPDPKSKQYREFAKYNCSADDFELRFSPKGLPVGKLPRCYRINWFVLNGW